MGSGPSDHETHSGEDGNDQRPLPKLEADPQLIGKTLVGSGAPEPKQRGRRRESRLGHRGR
jgi:hypothetical protein